MTKEDIEDYKPPVDNFDDTDDDDDSITITIGRKKKNKKPQMPIIPEPEKETPRYTFSTKEKYKKEIEGERARQKAIAKARAEYQPLEDELQAEREKTEKITSGEYVPEKKGFCDKHPKLCKAVGKGKTKSVPLPDTVNTEIPKKKSKRQLAKEQKEQERLDRIKKGTDTYCDRHPKLCKAGKIIGGTALVGAAVGAAAIDPTSAGLALGTISPSRKTKKSSQKSKSASKTAAAKRKTASSRSRTTASKTKSASKRSASTAKRRTTSQTARKPTQKRTTVKRATKSTPKKKTPKKPRNNDWWGAGDAGL